MIFEVVRGITCSALHWLESEVCIMMCMLTVEDQDPLELKEEMIEEMTPEPPQPEKRRPGRPRGTRKKKKPGNCFKNLGNS